MQVNQIYLLIFTAILVSLPFTTIFHPPNVTKMRTEKAINILGSCGIISSKLSICMIYCPSPPCMIYYPSPTCMIYYPSTPCLIYYPLTPSLPSPPFQTQLIYCAISQSDGPYKTAPQAGYLRLRSQILMMGLALMLCEPNRFVGRDTTQNIIEKIVKGNFKKTKCK